MESHTSIRQLLALVLPGAAVMCVTGGALLFARDAAWLMNATKVYPYIALVVSVILAWRFKRSRLFVGGLALALLHVLLAPWLLGYSIATLALAAILLPIGIALLVLVPDYAVTDSRVRLQFAMVFAPITVAGAFVALQPDPATGWLTWEFVDPILFRWTALPQPAFLLACSAAIAAFAAAAHTRRITEIANAWLVLAMLCAVIAPVGSVARGGWVLAGAVVLIIALIETSYAMAFHDELTGLPARRALNQALAGLRAPYTIAVVDIDHFKLFNDKHGHHVGDEVLRMVAGKLGIIQGGSAYRSGGEEFTIVFAGRTKQEALPALEAVRVAVADAKFVVRQTPRPKKKDGAARRGKGSRSQQQLQVTISVGAAGSTRASKDVAAVIKAADKAMYRAKGNGRNQVVA